MQKKNRYIKLILLIVGIGTMYKLAFFTDVFYIQFKSFFHLTNTQIGLLLSAYSVAQTITYAKASYLSDKFSPKKLIVISFLAVGITGLYFATAPKFIDLIICWIIWGIFCEGVYYPALAKTVRALGSEEEQGRMFGFLEGGRGIMDTVVSFLGLGVFIAFGSTFLGLKFTILFYSILALVLALLSFLFLPNSAIKKTNLDKTKRFSFKDYLELLKRKQIWIFSIVIFFIYAIYIGLIYLVPYIKNVYLVNLKNVKLELIIASVLGISIQYVSRIIGAPLGGILSDFVTRSVIKYLKFAFFSLIILFALLIILPTSSYFEIIAILIALLIGFVMLSMHGLMFAVVSEMKIPQENTGTVVSIACLIGYSPAIFGLFIYGNILDHFHGAVGYKIIFFLMIILAVFGIVFINILKKIKYMG